jgi:hypothetical protein
MATRARKQAARQPEIIDVDPVELKRNKFYQAQSEYLDALGIPTERRAMVAFSIGLATSMAVGATIGKITTMAMVGAVMLTGSAFLAMMIWIVGVVLAIYCGVKSFSMAFDYIAKGEIDRDVIRAKEWSENKVAQVRGWFKKQEVIA